MAEKAARRFGQFGRPRWVVIAATIPLPPESPFRFHALGSPPRASRSLSHTPQPFSHPHPLVSRLWSLVPLFALPPLPTPLASSTSTPLSLSLSSILLLLLLSRLTNASHPLRPPPSLTDPTTPLALSIDSTPPLTPLAARWTAQALAIGAQFFALPSLTCSRPYGPPVFVTPHPPQRISRTTTCLVSTLPSLLRCTGS